MPTRPFDAAAYFTTADAQLELIGDALRSGHAGYIASALGTIAKARGMGSIATATGLNRQSLYTALTEEGNPTLDTVMKVLDTVGLELVAKVKAPEPI